MKKKMLSLLFFLCSSSLCIIFAQIIPSSRGRVIEIVHSNIPLIKLPYFSDALILFQTVGTAALVDLESLNEIFLIMSVVQFLRLLCFVSTILPPLKNYHDKFRIGGLNGSGTEYIFSGHACYSAVSAFYLYNNTFFPLWIIVLYNLISQFLVIATHNHYTVDVILAWIITSSLYFNLHLCKEICWCNEFLTVLS